MKVPQSRGTIPNLGGSALGLRLVPKKNSLTDTPGDRKNSKLCALRTKTMPTVVKIVIAAQKTRPDVTSLSQNARVREWPRHSSTAPDAAGPRPGFVQILDKTEILTSRHFDAEVWVSVAPSSLASVAWLAARSSEVG